MSDSIGERSIAIVHGYAQPFLSVKVQGVKKELALSGMAQKHFRPKTRFTVTVSDDRVTIYTLTFSQYGCDIHIAQPYPDHEELYTVMLTTGSGKVVRQGLRRLLPLLSTTLELPTITKEILSGGLIDYLFEHYSPEKESKLGIVGRMLHYHRTSKPLQHEIFRGSGRIRARFDE